MFRDLTIAHVLVDLVVADLVLGAKFTDDLMSGFHLRYFPCGCFRTLGGCVKNERPPRGEGFLLCDTEKKIPPPGRARG